MVKSGDSRGWLCGGFFALGIPISLLQFLPGSSYLKLDPTGFKISSLYRRDTVDWKDVSRFGTFEAGRARMVGFDLYPNSQKYKFGRAISSAISGWDGGLPDTYGKSADELASLMESWLKKYGS